MHNGRMSDTVERIKEKMTIVEVVGSYVKLDRAGTALRARCPFHAEKTPSFYVSPERGTYHCFGCNQGGDIFTFVEQMEGVDFKGALKILAEKAGVEIVYEHGGAGKEEKDERDRLFEILEAATIFYISHLTPEARAYLAGRGVSDTTIKEFRLGFAGNGWTECIDHLKSKGFSERDIVEAGVGKPGDRGSLDKFRNRIMFPIADSAGRVIGFSGRTFGEHASPDAPKYLNSPETPLFHKSKILYGFDRAKTSIRKLNCAILVEGQMDLLMSHQSGWGNTVAVSGTAFTAEHAALIHRMTDNLVIALDGDQAGIKAAGKAARASLQAQLNVKVAELPTGLDPADLIQKEGPDAWKAAIRDAKDIITFLLDVLEKHTKGTDGMRRAVETIVLPFLSDVRSPIAREQYVKEIATRLGVSQESVMQAFANTPRDPEAPRKVEEEKAAGAEKKIAKEKRLFAILAWQEGLAAPLIDPAQLARDLEKVIGHEGVAAYRALPKNELEVLQIWAAKEYANTRSLPGDVSELFKQISPKIPQAQAQALRDVERDA